MKRAREKVEGVPPLDEDGDVGPEESTKLGLRVHEWGLNPLFWVSSTTARAVFNSYSHHGWY